MLSDISSLFFNFVVSFRYGIEFPLVPMNGDGDGGSADFSSTKHRKKCHMEK